MTTTAHPAPDTSHRAVEPEDGGAGLLLAFTATTTLMVVAIAAMAAIDLWWPIVPVVLIHWYATYFVMARLYALLRRE